MFSHQDFEEFLRGFDMLRDIPWILPQLFTNLQITIKLIQFKHLSCFNFSTNKSNELWQKTDCVIYSMGLQAQWIMTDVGRTRETLVKQKVSFFSQVTATTFTYTVGTLPVVNLHRFL